MLTFSQIHYGGACCKNIWASLSRLIYFSTVVLPWLASVVLWNIFIFIFNRQTQTHKSYVYFIYFFYIYGQLLMDLSFFSVLDTETLNSAENHKQSVLESSALKQHSSCCLESLWTLNCALTSPHVPVDWEDCWAESFQYCLKSLFFPSSPPRAVVFLCL